MARGALAALLAAATPAVPAEQSVIDDCIARLDPQLDIGYGRIAAKCPEVVRQLERDAGGAWLPRGWNESVNDLSAGSLREYRILLEREQAMHPLSRTPDVRTVAGVLAQLSGNLSESRWSQWKSWLRSLFEREDEPSQEGWAARMISHIGVSEWLIRLVAAAALGAVVVLALVILVNELRTAGWLGRRRRGRPARHDLVANGPRTLDWPEVEQAAVLDRPRVLLMLLIKRLGERGALAAPAGLTAKELVAAARLPDPQDGTRLAEVAIIAERVAYAARPAGLPADSTVVEIDAAVAHGRELLEHLQAEGEA